jgi:hypothetical protein
MAEGTIKSDEAKVRSTVASLLVTNPATQGSIRLTDEKDSEHIYQRNDKRIDQFKQRMDQ